MKTVFRFIFVLYYIVSRSFIVRKRFDRIFGREFCVRTEIHILYEKDIGPVLDATDR